MRVANDRPLRRDRPETEAGLALHDASDQGQAIACTLIRTTGGAHGAAIDQRAKKSGRTLRPEERTKPQKGARVQGGDLKRLRLCVGEARRRLHEKTQINGERCCDAVGVDVRRGDRDEWWDDSALREETIWNGKTELNAEALAPGRTQQATQGQSGI
ncbi:hypothetical protein ERJ75_001143200 [Trypanosoma vivax]|nr:hypothetical protein ERJ75_001143200 [Trypanosoma vivax]